MANLARPNNMAFRKLYNPTFAEGFQMQWLPWWRHRGSRVAALLFGSSAVLTGCRGRVTAGQCDELVGHYATLNVRERHPGMALSELRVEAEREQAAARNDDAFKNCTTEVTVPEYTCAAAAQTAASLLKCLE
jgi:hypothetical protein